ncbi:uncharacterized protein LOC142220456 isoform X1 [Haematobia irritans]|uniref:uncharacterized protein LOC142220456 isoform X1 n=2 Tax=Haematobia irritans TaxID=7368 RepID=UPI003F4F8168
MDQSLNSSTPMCRICKKRHFIKHCPHFQRMSAVERRNIIREKGFCFNCLCTAHQRNFCPSRNKCLVCNKNHHTMVHVDNIQQPNSQNSSNVSRSRPLRNAQNRTMSRRCTNNRTRPRRSSSVPHQRQKYLNERLSRRLSSHVFVPTALARVVTSTGPTKVRLLMSSGETQTVVLQKFVNRLNLSTSVRDHKEYCTINLESYHDPQIKIQITALVKPQFNTTLPKPTSEPSLRTIFDHITDLADPHFFNPTNIELIVANDQLSGILRAGMIQTSSHMPILQSSIFGWTVSGSCRYQHCNPARRAAC